jgi:hypothetical protein
LLLHRKTSRLWRERDLYRSKSNLEGDRSANYLDSLAAWSVSVITGLELIAGAKDKREVAEIDLVLGAFTSSRQTPRSASSHTTS